MNPPSKQSESESFQSESSCASCGHQDQKQEGQEQQDPAFEGQERQDQKQEGQEQQDQKEEGQQDQKEEGQQDQNKEGPEQQDQKQEGQEQQDQKQEGQEQQDEKQEGQGQQGQKQEGQGQNQEQQNQGRRRGRGRGRRQSANPGQQNQQGQKNQQMRGVEEVCVDKPPRGPMPGKTRSAPANPEARERARRFGFGSTHILVVVDESQQSEKVLESALHYRRRNDAIDFVAEVTLTGDARNFCQLYFPCVEHDERVTQKGKELISRLREDINEREIGRWECHLLAGKDPKKELLDYAETHDIDVIFVPVQGDAALQNDERAAHIANNSNCAVMLVR